jgi:hypothetical protein
MPRTLKYTPLKRPAGLFHQPNPPKQFRWRHVDALQELHLKPYFSFKVQLGDIVRIDPKTARVLAEALWYQDHRSLRAQVVPSKLIGDYLVTWAGQRSYITQGPGGCGAYTGGEHVLGPWSVQLKRLTRKPGGRKNPYQLAAKAKPFEFEHVPLPGGVSRVGHMDEPLQVIGRFHEFALKEQLRLPGPESGYNSAEVLTMLEAYLKRLRRANRY